VIKKNIIHKKNKIKKKKKKKISMGTTFNAHERIAFSVGDPVTSVSPPSYQIKYSSKFNSL